MGIPEIQDVIEAQRAFAKSGRARDIEFRIAQLTQLKDALKANEKKLSEAIHADFRKSPFETYLTELGMVYREIDDAVSHVARWSRPKRVSVGAVNAPGKGRVVPEPYGCALIIGAWNYPYQLALAPLVASMAAGNTSILKPSELSPRTSAEMARVLNAAFDPAYLHVIEGGVDTSQQLLAQRFDKIFFTGSTTVGKIVARAAAEHLTPVTLELGGKSPCLVFADADLERTAQRILWGKFLNAGQTCIAPDYLLAERAVYEPLLEALKSKLGEIVGSNPRESESYVRIINQRHTERLGKLIDPKKVFVGGKVSGGENYIEPTILRDVTFSDEVMKDEIFGPILPVIPFDDLDAVLGEIKSRPRPLALYAFTRDRERKERIIRDVSFGGGCINDVVMHISSSELPFGGVGASGMGAYHGEAGFRAFSHYKSVLEKSFWFEPPLKYAPYSDWKLKVLRAILG
jgi:aldehyde dehydrogenase (NAD+)